MQTKDIDVASVLNVELGIDADIVFDFIDPDPIGSASLSQVYFAQLADTGQKVVIKIKREGIDEIIESDLLIMKDMADLLEKYYENARQIGLGYIIRAFEKSVLSELSFIQELANIEKFRKNFEGDPSIYVPETYKHLSNKNILCMEYIDGIKVMDKEKLIDANLDPKDVASVVVNSYLKQILEFGFFHADPHSGNIFALPSGQVCFIDYGSIGKLMPRDKELLSLFIINVLRKKTKPLVRVIKKLAFHYNIENEAQLERDLYDFIDIIDTDSVKDIDLKGLVKRFSSLLNENRIILPDYIYLLVRGIVILEGIGRELGLETSIVEYIEPYGEEIMKQQLNPKFVGEKLFDKVWDLAGILEEIPEDIHNTIGKINNNDLKLTHNINGLADIRNSINRLALGVIIASSTIGSAILVLAEMPPKLWGVSVLGILGFLASGVMATIILLSILRNKKEN